MEQHRANTKDFGRPLPVEPMRVRRTYSGGAKIDGWHGEIGRYGCTRRKSGLHRSPEQSIRAFRKNLTKAFHV